MNYKDHEQSLYKMSIEIQPLRWIFVGPTNGAGCKTKTIQQLFLIIHLNSSLIDQNLSNSPPNSSPGQEHLLSRVHSHLKQCTQKYSQPWGETGTTLNFFSWQETQPWLDTEALGVLPRTQSQPSATPQNTAPAPTAQLPPDTPWQGDTGHKVSKPKPTGVGWTDDKKKDIDESHLLSAEALH